MRASFDSPAASRYRRRPVGFASPPRDGFTFSVFLYLSAHKDKNFSGRTGIVARLRPLPYGELGDVSNLYASLLVEALVDFEGVLGGLGRRVPGLVEGLHVLDVDYPSIGV